MRQVGVRECAGLPFRGLGMFFFLPLPYHLFDEECGDARAGDCKLFGGDW